MVYVSFVLLHHPQNQSLVLGRSLTFGQQYMQYRNYIRHKPALYDVVLAWVLSIKINHFSRILLWDELSNKDRRGWLPFWPKDKSDGAEEGPCLVDTSVCSQFTTLQISKKLFKSCLSLWAAFQLRDSFGCGGGRSQGILSPWIQTR